MARRKKRVTRRHKRRAIRKHRAHRRASARSGFGRSVNAGSGFSFDTIPRIALSALIIRFGSGLVYYWFRSQWQKNPDVAKRAKLAEDFKKAKILFPLLVIVLVWKKIIPPLPGLLPIAVASGIFTLIENTKTLKDLADFRSLDNSVEPEPTVLPEKLGFQDSARSWQQTRDQLNRMHTQSGLYLSQGNRTFNGLSIRTRPFTFNGRDPRMSKRFAA